MARKAHAKAAGEPPNNEDTSFSQGDSDDFDLDTFLAENDFISDDGLTTSRPRTARSSASTPAFAESDPETTLSYAAVGQDYPEIELVDPFEEPTSPESDQRSSAKKTSADKPSSTRQPRPSRRSITPEPELQPSTHEEPRRRSRRRSALPAEPLPSATGAAPTAFRQASMHDTSYRVRGGGIPHKRTPIVTIILAVIVIIALISAGYFLVNFVKVFVNKTPEADKVITLTPQQTRTAIDAEMPVVAEWLYAWPDEAFAAFQEAGWNVSITDRSTSDNPDSTATGKEIIHLAADIPQTVLAGFYESEFNAYDFDELQSNFNGAWMFDLTWGDMGGYGQIKYLNLSSEGLETEISHLLQLQGLSGDTTVVDKSGVDDFGNTFSVGYTTIGEGTYYWKAIGIAFDDYYQGKDHRKLADNAIFLKLTVSTFDFYGAGSNATLPTGEGAGEGEGTEETPVDGE